MGSFSIWHWLIVLFIILLLFGGKNKLSGLMGDMGKGLREFKDNFKNADKPAENAPEANNNNAATAQVTDKVINVQAEKVETK